MGRSLVVKNSFSPYPGQNGSSPYCLMINVARLSNKNTGALVICSNMDGR